MTTDNEQGYIVEFVTIGRSVKVTVIDPVSLKEVSMMGARGVSKDELIRLAVRKMHYVIERDKDS
ncbi:MAG: hypothetical protein SFT92_06415 [Rickettsiales bacterium]|nr:hypothetical protein [Rickettsiales bacterium]